MRLYLKRFFLNLFDLVQFGLIILVTLFISQLGFVSEFNDLNAIRLRESLPVSNQVVIVGIDGKAVNLLRTIPDGQGVIGTIFGNDSTQDEITAATNITFQSLSNLGENKPKAAFLDFEWTKEAQEKLNQLDYPVVIDQKNLDYVSESNQLSNIKYASFKPEINEKKQVDGFFPVKIENGVCLPSVGYLLFNLTTDRRDYCDLNQNKIYKDKAPLFVPFLTAQEQGDIDIEENIGVQSFTKVQKTEISFSGAIFEYVSIADLYNKVGLERVRNKTIVVGIVGLPSISENPALAQETFITPSGKEVNRTSLVANELNSYILGGVYQNSNENEGLVLLIIAYLLPVLAFFGHLGLQRLFEIRTNIRNKKLIFAFTAKGLLYIIEIVAYLGLFGAVFFGQLILHQELDFVKIILVTIILKVYFLYYNFVLVSRQKKITEEAFTRYINPDLLGEIQRNLGEIELGGQRREMTILFSDIRGFTSISEILEPAKLVGILNDYFEQMSKLIFKHNGTIDKFIGDAIMVFWNAPLVDNSHRLRAVKAALDMTKKLKEFNKAYPDIKDIGIGVGINTGEVIVGNIGSKQRSDYTVIGDDVNLASRLEGLTKKYNLSILCTHKLIDGLNTKEIIFRLVDKVVVKGKSNPINIYEPLENTPENKELKISYEEALEFYQKSQFVEAKKIWKSLAKSDKVSKVMLERTKTLKKNKDWNGTWTWNEK